ncbi:MAG: alpha-galactosidase [Verrucomicrobia bacterium]|nr:alpha-galactosidase [Verrucomicrobiota bacterium]
MRNEPPIAHADSHWDPDTRTLEYAYNGRTLVSMQIPGEGEVMYRVESDGEVASSPFFQQIYLVVMSEPVKTTVTFTLSEDGVCMRPRRARHEEAILGQIGRPLIDGVNGLYDVLDDLLVDWHGAPWRWTGDQIERNQDDTLSASIEVELSPKPWIINLRPHYYRVHLGYEYHKPWEQRPNLKSVNGWCSWEAYRREVTEESVLQVADFLARHLKPYGLEYVQIDDGYQGEIRITPDTSLADSWLTPNEKFPSGLDGLAAQIRDRGLEPALWLNSNITHAETSGDTPDFLLRHKDGTPLKPAWMAFAFDCTPDNVERHIRPLYEGLRACGFSYIKLDNIRHLLYDALQKACKLGLLSNDEVETRFRNYLRVAREGLGHDIYFLASWGVLNQTIGIFDACRIATDSNPEWRKIRMQIVEEARWWHTQRILYLNDPDHMTVRTKPMWARNLVSNVTLTGGLFMLSDPIEKYDVDRLRIIQRCLPSLTTVTAETGPLDMTFPAYAWTKAHGAAFKGEIMGAWQEIDADTARTIAGDHGSNDDDHPFSSLWAFHFRTEAGQWCVVQRSATIPLRASKLPLGNVGLDPDKIYLAFNFWSQRFLGTVSATIEVPALEAGDTQVIALREAKDGPQFLASTRHVSMDAVSVKTQTWKDQTLLLTIEGVPGTSETYWLHRPKGWKLDALEADGADVTEAESQGEAIGLKLTFREPTSTLRIAWSKP